MSKGLKACLANFFLQFEMVRSDKVNGAIGKWEK